LDELVKTTVLLNYLIGIVLSGLIYLFSRQILSMFLTDPSTVDIAQKSLYLTLWAFILLGNVIILSGLMRSSGTVFWPTLLIILSAILVEIPAAYILSQALGLYGVWLAYPVAFMVALTGQHLYYHKFWKRKTHQRFFDKPEETRT
jgi:Na+-driven multidrug efflux pump